MTGVPAGHRRAPMAMLPETLILNARAPGFCHAFVQAPGQRPRFLLGRNDYAKSVADAVAVDGFMDDFTEDTTFHGMPVKRTAHVPPDSLVVSTLIGRPLTAKRVLDARRLENLDYFAFGKYSGLNIKPVSFWSGFYQDFQRCGARYKAIHDLLADEDSKDTLAKLLNFRLSCNLDYMEGFAAAEQSQYFEDFLCLAVEGETLVDIGGFDGGTSLRFIQKCPRFARVHFFEPDTENMRVAIQRLGSIPRVHFHPIGLSNETGTLSFRSTGPTARFCPDGDTRARVDRLDNVLLDGPPTFLKIDVEGAEEAVLDGAKQTIRKHHPRIAVSVYHKGDDLRRIPEQVLSFREDYDVYLRHYSEGVVETVAFFVPRPLGTKE